MKAVSTPILLLVFLSISLTGWRASAQPATSVVGGEYVITAGQTVQGNLQVLFAQVILEPGARVEGTITAVSSTLDLAGSVGGSILMIESDVTVRATAQLAKAPKQIQAIPLVILLPQIARSGQGVHSAR